jgi:hypothetical protein
MTNSQQLLDLLNDLTDKIQESKQPKVKFTGNLEEMAKEAEQIKNHNINCIHTLLISKILPLAARVNNGYNLQA